MIRLFSLLTFLSLSSLCSAQLINDGGTITIQSGATLYVETDVTNNVVGPSTGTINIEGTLEVQGDLTNNGAINTIAGSLLKFSGNQASNFLSNGDSIENMQMAKDDATNGTVTLTDNLTINTNLDFEPSSNGNKLILGTNNLSLAQQATTITDGTANDYIVADESGKVEKVVDTDALFFFPVGDLNAYSPIEVDYSANSYSNSLISVNLDNVVHPNKPSEATDYIERYWNVDQTGITNYSATLTGTYDAADVMGTAGDVMGASQEDGVSGSDITDWSFDGSSNAANQVIADVDNNTDLTGFNFFGKADLKVFLSGPFNGTTMSTTLAGIPSFPTSTPYDVAPWNAPTETIPGGTPPVNTTDWILIEARDVNNPATILGQKSAFILNDGSIVGLDGGDLFIKNADPTSIVRVRHRNHLGVRTDAGYDMIASPLFDYSTGTGVYSDGGITNPNMNTINGNMAMWAGDVDGNDRVRYLPSAFPPIPSDALSILSNGLGGVPNAAVNSYSIYDVNMDGIIRYLPSAFPPVPSDALYLLSNTLGGVPNADYQSHN